MPQRARWRRLRRLPTPRPPGCRPSAGTAQVGETLTADTTGITDDDGLDNATFSYQWLADDAEINGADRFHLHPGRLPTRARPSR